MIQASSRKKQELLLRAQRRPDRPFDQSEPQLASTSWLDRFCEGLLLDTTHASCLRGRWPIDRLVLPILTMSITPESPKAGIEAAGTSENEVRFGISVCAARPAAAPSQEGAQWIAGARASVSPPASCDASKVFSQY